MVDKDNGVATIAVDRLPTTANAAITRQEDANTVTTDRGTPKLTHAASGWQSIELDDPEFYQPVYHNGVPMGYHMPEFGQVGPGAYGDPDDVVIRQPKSNNSSPNQIARQQQLQQQLQQQQREQEQTGKKKQPSLKDGQGWAQGLCECMDDKRLCLCGAFCTPCLACKVSMDMDESPFVPVIVPCWLLVLRTEMRAYADIPGSVLRDCCTVTWCYPCALCQLAREVWLQQSPPPQT